MFILQCLASELRDGVDANVPNLVIIICWLWLHIYLKDICCFNPLILLLAWNQINIISPNIKLFLERAAAHKDWKALIMIIDVHLYQPGIKCQSLVIFQDTSLHLLFFGMLRSKTVYHLYIWRMLCVCGGGCQSSQPCTE